MDLIDSQGRFKYTVANFCYGFLAGMIDNLSRCTSSKTEKFILKHLFKYGAPVKVRRPIDYNPSLAATLGPRQPNPNLNQGVVSLTPGLATGLHGPDRISWDFPLPESGCCWLNTWTVESNPCDYADTARSRALFAYVNFVDLARSERASQAMTACTRLREGSYINHSLLSLGTVIQKLR
ncbi:hypothetical protein JHK87_001217 [Glycine soja]|nr:hypothetical protein JHK87_001217 [Glycine soja]